VLANLRPRGVGETLDAAIAIYRARFGALVRTTALVLIPVEIVNVLITLSTTPSGTTIGPSGVTPVYDSRAAFWTPLAGSLLTRIVAILSIALATAAVVRLVADTYLDADSSRSASTRLALNRFGAVIWLAIVNGVVVTAATFLCVLPGIWLQVAWSVAAPALLLENRRVGAALGRSFQLAKGNWWRCFGVVLVGGVLSLFVEFALSAGAALVLHSYAHGTAAIVIDDGVAGTIAAVLTTPFVAASIIVMYFDLRIRSEGFDVQMALRDIDLRDGAPVRAG
jgi:hypothetical protein